MRNHIKTMTTEELKQLQQTIEKELTSRQEVERKMAKMEINNLLSTIDEICDKYNITLYDEYSNIIIPNELVM